MIIKLEKYMKTQETAFSWAEENLMKFNEKNWNK